MQEIAKNGARFWAHVYAKGLKLTGLKMSRNRLKTVLSLLAVLLLILFSPSLYMVLWRLSHRPQITVRGVEFFVPGGWVATPKNWGDTPGIMRLPATLLGIGGRYSTIQFPQRRDTDPVSPEGLARW